MLMIKGVKVYAYFCSKKGSLVDLCQGVWDDLWPAGVA